MASPSSQPQPSEGRSSHAPTAGTDRRTGPDQILSGGDGHARPDSFGPPSGWVALDPDDSRLVVHVLVTFERLLRHGDLTEQQLALLTREGTGRAEAAADLLMAEVVGEAIDAVRSQLGDD